MIEHDSKDGCKGVYACGPLNRPRYINPKLEKELVEFKIEVEEKFEKSVIRKFKYPRMSVSDDESEDGLNLSLDKIEVRNMSIQKGARTGRRLILDQSSIMNYQTEVGSTRNDGMLNLSALQDNPETIHSSITQFKKQPQILDKYIIGKESTLTNHNLKYKKFVDESQNFKDFKMPELKVQNRYPQPVNPVEQKTQSVDRYQNAKTQRIQKINTTNNIFNVNNPQVIIQTPQNNTIILVDSLKSNGSKKNILQQLEKKGLINQTFDDAQVNKSFQRQDPSNLQSYRTKIQQPQYNQPRLFESYIKNHPELNPDFNLKNIPLMTSTNQQAQMFQQQRTKLSNILGQIPQPRVKYESLQGSRNQAQSTIGVIKKQRNKHDLVSKSFVFPPTNTLGNKQI